MMKTVVVTLIAAIIVIALTLATRAQDAISLVPDQSETSHSAAAWSPDAGR